MIVWINGPFGSGKSQTAYELHRRLPGSRIYDPEFAGYWIRKQMPKEASRSDFQDYPVWREITYGMLAHMEREYPGVLIVPMTIARRDYWEETVGRLLREGIDVRHYTLCASRETILRRLKSRGEGETSWAARQLDRCLEGQRDERFRQHLDTECWTIWQTVEAVADGAGLTLLEDRRGPLRRKLDQAVTQLKQLRFFS
ncbi:tunicamycin resistance protein [Paenibacillus sp. J31TS4]|uniref:AAA family ATPase n=1 Tax=Paenibacillus sp. J31TS4 TaxID=2807195 RepID=UPI001B12CABE|nr:AAA family ATPase [Paenibacillus sp. J31TS4]GIP39500.1 tunicamycin resistance protein [Paenibacillus sp. J31TS4]